MKFHACYLSMQGDLAEKAEITGAKLYEHPNSVQYVDWFAGHLRVRSEEIERDGEISTPVLENNRGLMRYMPLDRFNATVTWDLDGRFAARSMMLSGLDAGSDTSTISALQYLITKQFKDSPFEPGFDLLEIQERPVLFYVPWPNLSHADQQTTINISIWLAAAFFDRY